MRALLSLIALVVLVAACGYKGPLYLPKSKPPAPERPAPDASQRDSKKPGE